MFSEQCIRLIKKYEGFSSVPYLCPAGYWTVGYGTVVREEDVEKYKESPITKEQGEILLIENLTKMFKIVRPMLKNVRMETDMWDAIMSFVYNVGTYAFYRSTLRRKLLREEYFEAGDEFRRWVYVGGRKLIGLVRRREEERRLFLEGVKKLNL